MPRPAGNDARKSESWKGDVCTAMRTQRSLQVSWNWKEDMPCAKYNLASLEKSNEIEVGCDDITK